MVSSRELQQGGMEQGALQLLVSGDGILTALRLMTAWGLAGAKRVGARIVSYHLKKKKTPPKKEKLERADFALV